MKKEIWENRRITVKNTANAEELTTDFCNVICNLHRSSFIRWHEQKPSWSDFKRKT